MPPNSSLEWNRKISSQVEAEGADNNQRGMDRSNAQRPLGRRTRRVGKILKRNIARSLPFHRNPQETSRMLLKMEKDVNARLRLLEKVSASSSYCAREKAGEKTSKNALALAISCGRLAPIAPHSCDSRNCKRYQSGEGREIHSGGRATWASFCSWSSG